jgi:threonine aldolase
MTEDAPEAAFVVEKAREEGVLIIAFGHKKIRAVTHLDVTKEMCERATEILIEIIDS